MRTRLIGRSYRRATRSRLIAVALAMVAITQHALSAPGEIFVMPAPAIGSPAPKGADIKVGEASVSTQTGALQWSYPISTPPGRHGMAPQRRRVQPSVHQHINSPGVRAVEGTYHKQAVTHYLDPSTGLNVIADPAGNFISGWRLSPAQLQKERAHPWWAVAMAEDVTLTLSRDEAVVFFAWLHRFNSEDGHRLEDQAEQRVLWNLEASLESTLVEPFKPEYGEILAAARSRVRDPIE